MSYLPANMVVVLGEIKLDSQYGFNQTVDVRGSLAVGMKGAAGARRRAPEAVTHVPCVLPGVGIFKAPH